MLTLGQIKEQYGDVLISFDNATISANMANYIGGVTPNKIIVRYEARKLNSIDAEITSINKIAEDYGGIFPNSVDIWNGGKRFKTIYTREEHA